MPSYDKLGDFNPPKILEELRTAVGIQDNTVGYATIAGGLKFIVPDTVTEAEIDSVITAHNPASLTLEQQQDAVRDGAKSEIQNIPNYATWAANEAETWIDANVTDLASAKTVLVALAKMVIALRNETFPDLQGS